MAGVVNMKSDTRSNSEKKVIHEDTRQKIGEHNLKRQYFESNGWTIARTKLYVGDYIFPGGLIAVDTKASIYELAQNLRQQHERFRRECVRAREAGYQLVVLVENADEVITLYDLADWIEPLDHFVARKRKSGGRVKVRFTGTSLYKACQTMTVKYGVRFEFCPPEGAGARVIEILQEGEHARDNA